ncbi:surfeit locus protein 2 isoform X1 [Sphaerodactylus townsendi]|uniref:surfeit locus protein 2 isoform X1 n=1 Tax=Sphaerodactylus townsendi TaxID=933632 RepID=UPI002026753F|nr:surfeit locus protein 2 isoform X1 [Sphaerodactylus townsendi]
MSEEPAAAAAAAAAETLERFLQRHPALRLLPSGTRVQCTLTGHELPRQLATLRAYTASKKYLRLTKVSSTWDYREYEPHIVPSTKNPHLLFCKLTLRHFNRTPEQVLHHVRGRRYQKALKRYEDCQKEGVEYVPACLLRRQPRRQWHRNNQPNGSRQPHQKREFWEPPPSDEDGEETDDSMSDLYPPMFPKGPPVSKKDSDVFMTDGNEEAAKPATADADGDEAVDVGSAMGGKRRNKQTGPIKKKFKKSAQKTQELSERNVV